MPASAPLFVSIDTDMSSSQWQMVDDLAGRFPDKQKAVDAMKRELLKQGLAWDNDVKPALGPELDIVTLDLEHPDETVGLMEPGDKSAFERAVQKGNATNPSSKLLYETFQGWTVISEKQSAIDAFKQASDSAKRTLADDATFRRAMDKSGAGLVRAYVNGAQVTAAARKFMGPEATRYIDKLGTLDWLTTTLNAKSDGLAWDTVVHGTPGKMFHARRKPRQSVGSLEQLVPKDALLYLAFRGTKGMFGGLADNPILLQPGFKDLGRILEQLGTILQGENALYVRPAGGKYPEVTFVAAPGGGVDGAAVLDRALSRFARELGGRPRRTTILGVPARVVGGGPVTLRYANVKGKLVVTNLPSGIAFTKNGGKAVSESDEYKQASASSGLPAKPQVVLYVDIHSTIPAVERFAGMHLPDGVRRNLSPLRSAVEYAVSRSHELQVSFFLRIR